MEAKANFLKQLGGYLDLEFNEFDCKRICGYLDEYRKQLPIPNEKIRVVTNTKIVYKNIDISGKKSKNNELVINPSELIDIVTDKSGVSIEQLQGRRRDGDILVARHVAMYLLRKECDSSWRFTGEVFNRDHTTAIHAYRHVNNMVETGNKKYLWLLNEVIPILQKKIA